MCLCTIHWPDAAQPVVVKWTERQALWAQVAGSNPLGSHDTTASPLFLAASIRFVLGVCNPFPPVTRQRPAGIGLLSIPHQMPICHAPDCLVLDLP